VIDADRGVVVPMSLPEIEKNPEAIVPYYRAAGYLDKDTAPLVKIYGAEGNVVLPPNGARSYAPRNYFIEKMTYVLIWLIPAMMMAAGATLAWTRLVARLRAAARAFREFPARHAHAEIETGLAAGEARVSEQMP
jgi:hypothetical protein